MENPATSNVDLTRGLGAYSLSLHKNYREIGIPLTAKFLFSSSIFNFELIFFPQAHFYVVRL